MALLRSLHALTAQVCMSTSIFIDFSTAVDEKFMLCMRNLVCAVNG